MTDDKRQRSVKRSDKRPIVWCLVSRTRLTRLSMTSETLCVWATPPCTRSKTSSPGSTKTPNEAQCLCVLVNNWYMFIYYLNTNIPLSTLYFAVCFCYTCIYTGYVQYNVNTKLYHLWIAVHMIYYQYTYK